MFFTNFLDPMLIFGVKVIRISNLKYLPFLRYLRLLNNFEFAMSNLNIYTLRINTSKITILYTKHITNMGFNMTLRILTICYRFFKNLILIKLFKCQELSKQFADYLMKNFYIIILGHFTSYNFPSITLAANECRFLQYIEY